MASLNNWNYKTPTLSLAPRPWRISPVMAIWRCYIRIDGHSKDIIIRGGENLPVVEIENLLYQHPSVAVVAVVGYPDERLGERSCAVVVLHPGTTLTLNDQSTYLSAANVTRSYHPEKLLFVDEIPRTPSGKIQKSRLRELTSGGTTSA